MMDSFHAVWVAILLYLALGLYVRHRERRFRPNCPRGDIPTLTTMLFWPWKIAVVFWKKWRRG
ncbi:MULTISPECIES: hypothetical protein [unclassified Saccharibacter]|uniref:hypothetical protein n=1 Tax=unclassified Saccharibacter TaxID=2648722 RepID=UPI00132717B5|nr:MULTISPECIES: hypothetical protein [unclassified Saccharibacter]MXV35718.1 hypothetical protein [Saccharibacter sp. EH611]MXV58331.1 hypothetical protein [Saccharibacter sp. EH70]MXV65860.1 hypothetical protein [Saccharibacter sp. EH60]